MLLKEELVRAMLEVYKHRRCSSPSQIKSKVGSSKEFMSQAEALDSFAIGELGYYYRQRR